MSQEGSASSTRGNFQFTTAYSSDLECAICLLPWEEAVEARPCGHIFCSTCLRQCNGTGTGKPSSGSTTCPTCRSVVASLQPPHRVLGQMVGSLTGKCLGCKGGWTGTYEAFRISHSAACPRDVKKAVPMASSSTPQPSPPASPQSDGVVAQRNPSSFLGFFQAAVAEDEANSSRGLGEAAQVSTNVTAAPVIHADTDPVRAQLRDAISACYFTLVEQSGGATAAGLEFPQLVRLVRYNNLGDADTAREWLRNVAPKPSVSLDVILTVATFPPTASALTSYDIPTMPRYLEALRLFQQLNFESMTGLLTKEEAEAFVTNFWKRESCRWTVAQAMEWVRLWFDLPPVGRGDSHGEWTSVDARRPRRPSKALLEARASGRSPPPSATAEEDGMTLDELLTRLSTEQLHLERRALATSASASGLGAAGPASGPRSLPGDAEKKKKTGCKQQ